METDNNKNKIMMIVIIVLLVILIGFVIGIGVVMLRLQSAAAAQPHIAMGVPGSVSPEDITTVPLSAPIATNLRRGADNLDRLIRLSLSIGIHNTQPDYGEFINMLRGREDIIRDISLSVIQGRTAEELQRPDGRDGLAQELLERFQNEFQSNLIVRVFVTEWALD